MSEQIPEQPSQDLEATHGTFVPYIRRTRELYLAQGYTNPYDYAFHDDVPFATLDKPLSEARIALVTTSTPWGDSDDPNKRPRPVKHVYSVPINPVPSRLYTDDLAWDKESTHTNDIGSFFPLTPLLKYAEEGRIGSVAARFHGVPTDYSQRRTIDVDGPEILARCREDGVDAVLLAPL